tara:strand:- start:323 stop:451 length:129 start_codon:yes stop_codon:yes gene_type:complete
MAYLKKYFANEEKGYSIFELVTFVLMLGILSSVAVPNDVRAV